MYNRSNSPTLTNVTFVENSAYSSGMGDGGGIFNYGSSPTLTNVTFMENSARSSGGGMYNKYYSSPTLTNVVFSKNWLYYGYGGAMFSDQSSPALTNVTVSDNVGKQWGGGIYNDRSVLTLTNCILWGNVASEIGSEQIYNSRGGTATVTYSIVQGGWTGTGNVDANPLFVDPGNDDVRLRPGSPAMEAGNNAAVPADVADLDGDGNTSEPTPLDAGMLSRFVDITTVADTGSGTPPIVDMGAHEAPPNPGGSPTTSDSSVSTVENTAVAFQTGDFPFGDVDPGDTLQAVRIATLPGVGSLTLSGNPVIELQDIAVGDIPNLVYTPPADVIGDPLTTFSFAVIDGYNVSSSAAMSITVTPANSAPTISDIGDQLTVEDTATGAIGFTVNDAETAAGSLTVTATSDNQTLIPDGNIVLSGADENRTITLTPAPDRNGTATITVTVSDGEFQVDDAFVLTVDAVNDAPSFDIAASHTVLEDAGGQSVASFATNISAGPPDESGQTLTFNITGNTNAALFSTPPAIGADGTLIYTPLADANGTATVTVELQDNGGTANGGDDTSPLQTFDIIVTSVNDAPTVTVNETTVTVPEGTTATNSGTFDDVDLGDSITVSASIGTITQDAGNSGNWSWTYPTTDDEVQTVTITADDDHAGIAQTTFELTVQNVPPAANAGGPYEIQEGEGLTLSGSGSDPSPADQAILTYSWDLNGDGVFGDATGATPTVAWSALESLDPPVNDDGVYTIALQVADDDGGAVPVSGVTRASVDSSGNQGDDYSYAPSISSDGRFVAFRSYATNLVAGDTNAAGDIFVHDRQTGQTQRVSVDSSGNQGNSDSHEASISSDGRFVAFRSKASNLVAGDTNGQSDIFVHDRLTGQTQRVSVDSSGNQANSHSSWASISSDGGFVAFVSSASNLVAGDTNGHDDIFVAALGRPAVTVDVTVNNVAPTAGISGPTAGFRDVTQRFVLSAADPSTADQASPFTFAVDWENDGIVDQTVTDMSDTEVTHVYADAGTYTIGVTATDKDGGQSSTVNHTITIDVIAPGDLASIIENLDPSDTTVTLNDVAPANINDFIAAIADLPARDPGDPVIQIVINLDHGNFGLGRKVDVPAGYTVVINGQHQVVIQGSSPALTLGSGDLVALGDLTFVTTTDDPTILVEDGHLTLRDSPVQETTGGEQAAIEILGGSVDLGTTADLGGNMFNINGAGLLVRNTGANPVSAVGNTWQVDGTSLSSNFAIEDDIFHALDPGGGGPVSYVADNVYVTLNEGTLFAVDLPTLVADLGLGGLSFSITGVTNGTAELLSDGVTAQFSSPDNGLAAFTYTASEDRTIVATRNVNFLVENVAPTITLSGAATTDEGSEYTFTLGPVTDPGDDTITDYVVHWGDGTSSTYTASSDATHVYADGDSSPTVTVDLVDEDGTHAGAGTLSLAVDNVAPTIVDLVNSTETSGPAEVGENVAIEVSFADPGFDSPPAGTLEEFDTSTVDWGDGTIESVPGLIVTEIPGSPGVLTEGSLHGTHAYAAAGLHTVTITVRDDDGGQATALTTVSVTGVGLHDGVLQIVGTEGRDHVEIELHASGGSHGGSDGGSDRGADQAVMRVKAQFNQGGSDGGRDGETDGGSDGGADEDKDKKKSKGGSDGGSDGQRDKLKGGKGRDWFFADLDGLDGDDDRVRDKRNNELLDVILDLL